jgi:YidC/Oxa1 family membrane protein insertase
MAQLQPQIEELRNKFKGKPERLNQATMELYKREKVNPIGGCLPMLLQMPIFFALYTVLMEHFDLRGAAFIVPWISDLSAPERFLPLGFELPLLGWSDLRLLPFLMLGTTFLQTKIMPTAQTGSANQMRMITYAMPVVFFFILYNLASGLVLYWTVQNILTVVQQLYINSQRDDRGGPSSKNALVNKKRPT